MRKQILQYYTMVTAKQTKTFFPVISHIYISYDWRSLLARARIVRRQVLHHRCERLRIDRRVDFERCALERDVVFSETVVIRHVPSL
jgi:hypothetical protein